MGRSKAAYCSRINFAIGCATLLAVAGIACAAPAPSAVVLYPLSPPTGFNGVSAATYLPRIAVGGQVVGASNDSNGISHAILWTATGSTIDLNPGNTSFVSISPTGIDATQQAGFGTTADNHSHALLWSGSSASMIDLTPDTLTDAAANAVAGTQQVGWGMGSSTNNSDHAMLWTGTASSATDLNPAGGYDHSGAAGTNGSMQVGWAFGNTTHTDEHAFTWAGTAASAVDINPGGYDSSSADSISNDGTQVTGLAWNISDFIAHAMLWHVSGGAVTSTTDLSPTDLPDLTSSEAFDSNGIQQVGFGNGDATNDNDHALLWYGSGDSAVDLHALLPAAGQWISSDAFSIDHSGNIYGLADGTLNGVSGLFAIEWAASAPVLGDANLDGAVNAADYTALLNGFSEHLAGWANGDFNGDGVVNGDDWALFQLGLAEYDAGEPISVPEPTSLALLSIVAFPLLRRRAKK